MADFEPMPVGTRQAMKEAALLLRNRDTPTAIMVAEQIEALLAMPDFSNGDRLVLASGQSCMETRSGEWTMTFDEPVEMVPDLSGHGRHLRWENEEGSIPVQVRGESIPVETFDPDFRASVLELTPSMQLAKEEPGDGL